MNQSNPDFFVGIVLKYMRFLAHIGGGSLMMKASEAAQLFKALSDPTRLRIARLMSVNAVEVCVCELVDSLCEAQYHVSRHLRELREAGLLHTEKEGRWVYYRLSDNETVRRLAHFVATLPAEPFADDQKNFEARLRLRVGGRCCIGIQNAYLADAPISFGAREEALETVA